MPTGLMRALLQRRSVNANDGNVTLFAYLCVALKLAESREHTETMASVSCEHAVHAWMSAAIFPPAVLSNPAKVTMGAASLTGA